MHTAQIPFEEPPQADRKNPTEHLLQFAHWASEFGEHATLYCPLGQTRFVHFTQVDEFLEMRLKNPGWQLLHVVAPPPETGYVLVRTHSANRQQFLKQT